MGLPAATEFLDPIVPQYIADLVSWAAIGARTTESQTHREMASGLSMPVGLKNSTDGSLQVAIDAMGAARHPHSFLGINEDGVTSIVRTAGNPHAHVVLRGGRAKTNYDADSIRAAEEKLKSEKLPPVLMVDCSHANSEKQFARQEDVWRSVIRQRVGRHPIAHRPDGREQPPRRQPADSQKFEGVALRRVHHGFLHRLGNNGADAALGARNLVRGGVHRRSSQVTLNYSVAYGQHQAQGKRRR